MRLNDFFSVFLLILSLVLSDSAEAEESEEKREVLPVNQILKTYTSELVEKNEAPITQNKLSSALNELVENDADRYLLGLLEGAWLYQQLDYQAAIDKLEETQDFADNLAPEQVDSLEFRELHRLLAKSYVAIKDYDKAFVEKKKYLLSLSKDTAAVDKARIENLENKYQIEQKNKANLLLEEQSRLKKLKIAEARQQKADNERDFWALVCVFIIFFLLMLRQLNLRRRLLWLAQIDSLTRLKNRTSLFDEGFTLVEQAKRGQYSLSAILIDLDHFKKINDEYGHSMGDKVLHRVAQLGKEVMRSRDVLARLGGEEFVALLPSASAEEAKAIAVRLKDKIAQETFGTDEQPIHVTASLGVVEFSPQMKNLDELIQHADQAMYRAKSNGRNQVMLAEQHTDS